MDGVDDLLELGFGVGGAHQVEHVERFFGSVGGDEPARRAGDAEQHVEEQERRKDGDAELPPPLEIAEVASGDEEVGKVGDQDADDDVDLEEADHAAAPLGGGELCDVDGAEHGGAADADAADEAEGEQGIPIPGEGAADRRDEVEDGHDAERFAAADPLAEHAGEHGAEDGADQAKEDGEAEGVGREVKDLGELLGGSGDDSGVEAEQEAAKGPDDGAFEQVAVHAHRCHGPYCAARRARLCPSVRDHTVRRTSLTKAADRVPPGADLSRCAAGVRIECEARGSCGLLGREGAETDANRDRSGGHKD